MPRFLKDGTIALVDSIKIDISIDHLGNHEANPERA